ncbi:flavin reductase family protein [Micromonospora sp. NPDC050980]|uniref:flavin reductase family protein n=1 Tax=Micromonospora sp. NPDC050980 TaxID=3155161 RepID=UPI0033EE1BEE
MFIDELTGDTVRPVPPRQRPPEHGPDRRAGPDAAEPGGSAGPDAAEPGGLRPDEFRRALARCASGVVVVTAAAGPTGMTASSFTSVSQSPPLVSFCVDRAAGSRSTLCAAGHFAVNVLADTQAETAALFARRDVDRFALSRWRRGRHGLPLLDGAAAHLVCHRHRIVPLGDHFLVVGLLVAAEHHRPGAPLLHHQGRYGRFTPEQ